MSTGWVWHERYGWYDTGHWPAWVGPGGWGEPVIHIENGETKRRLASLVAGSGLAAQLVPLEPRIATFDELARVHTPEYLEYLQRQDENLGGGFADEGINTTPFAHRNLEIARLAAGGVMVAANAVATGEVTNAYALTRPPGHHATASGGQGFCVLANIALAIQSVRELGHINRIAVIDWDVHHGNGTQDIFWDDPDVLTISVHQDRLFPLDTGLLSEVGGENAIGSCLNIPLPAGSGNGAYEHAFETVVKPAIDRFEPDIIFVASGYDSSAYDPNGRMLLYSASYRWMTEHVMRLAKKHCEDRLVVVHEGGYSSYYVPFCGIAVVEALSGISTKVRDTSLERKRADPGHLLLAHQADVVAKAAENVLLVPTRQGHS